MAPLASTKAVYIVTNKRNGTLYTGVTSNLYRRAWEHRHSCFEGFASKYACTRLVWFEVHDLMGFAIQRETSIKRYRRAWKLNLIEEMNPNWDDLATKLIGDL